MKTIKKQFYEQMCAKCYSKRFCIIEVSSKTVYCRSYIEWLEKKLRSAIKVRKCPKCKQELSIRWHCDNNKCSQSDCDKED